MNEYGIELRGIQPKDLPQLRRWRNRPDIRLRMVNTKYISACEHVQWFSKMLVDESQVHWALWVGEALVGYAGIKGRLNTNLFGQEVVETGLYIGVNQEKFDFPLSLAAALTQLDYVFMILKVRKVKTLVRSDNQVAKRFNKVLGYSLRKFDINFDEQMLDGRQYLKAKSFLLPIFNQERKYGN